MDADADAKGQSIPSDDESEQSSEQDNDSDHPDHFDANFDADYSNVPIGGGLHYFVYRRRAKSDIS